ncbi:MAG TPA: DUF2339 domain-containing protein [Solirubrobacteraceae bacterium]|nr:DUF2339 domain-containing protein [Solirubrobacteraceae bacterium]
MTSVTPLQRLEDLEYKTRSLTTRLEALEAHTGVVAAPSAPPPEPVGPAIWAPPLTAGHPQPSPSPSPSPTPAQPRPSLEDLLGGRVLAWAGGLAVLIGIALLLAIAVSNGWIGEGARTLLAGSFSLALIGGGMYLQERRRRYSDAALAAFAAGISGLFVTVAVGSPVYGVLPAGVAHGLALCAGALAAAAAVRWQSRGIGALGIVGALLAPVLAGAPAEASTLALLWLAGLSGVAVVVWQRWNWLSVAVFALATLQWLWWIADSSPSHPAALFVLTAFGLLNVGAAIGFELRVPAATLRISSAMLLALNALVLALAGWWALDGSTLAHVWLVALAAVHVAVGMATRSTRIAREVRLLSLTLGVVLADVAAATILDGPILAAAWAVTMTGFALLARSVIARRKGEHDELLLGLGLGGHLLLSATQALAQAPPEALAAGDPISFSGHLAIAGVAAAAFVAGRFAADIRPQWRAALDATAMAGIAYLLMLTLDGPVLAAAFAAQALALGTIAARMRDEIAACGAGAFLALALGHALAFEAPPTALVDGLGSIPDAALALGAAALVALRGAQLLERYRPALAATGVLTLLYLASATVVTVANEDLGQLLMSGLWATTGLAGLIAGLVRDERTLRLGSLALLGVTIGKVFLYDLAALESLYRVGSFIALGLLLLLAAGLWQRMRPRPLPDLRTAPPALR